MRAVVQKVAQGRVTVDNEITGEIGQGLLVFLGVTHDDTQTDAKYMAEKIANLRIFEDDDDKLNLSIKDIGGAVLSISQFTLYGDCRRGRRPSFTDAARPDAANALYEQFNQLLENEGVRVQTGRFQTHMMVDLTNDGPVTVLLDSKKTF